MNYLAIALIGAGSSYGRSSDREDAIEICKHRVEQDWSSLYDLDGQPCGINVFEVPDNERVWWDHAGVHGENANRESREYERLELRTVTLSVPKRRRR